MTSNLISRVKNVSEILTKYKSMNIDQNLEDDIEVLKLLHVLK